MTEIVAAIMIAWTVVGVAWAGNGPGSDVLSTQAGDLRMTFLGHASLMFSFGGKVVHVDPWGKMADYSKLPKADLILITHEHFDHLDPDAVAALRTTNTVVILPAVCSDKVTGGTIMKNGDVRKEIGVEIEAVPAYNLAHKRPDGQPFHAKGVGNGYVLGLGGCRVYVAGDTENTPEMKALTRIDVAFLPMNLPYTMTPAMVADAVLAFRPKILYPYHYGETDPAKLTALLKDAPEIEVRIRALR